MQLILLIFLLLIELYSSYYLTTKIRSQSRLQYHNNQVFTHTNSQFAKQRHLRLSHTINGARKSSHFIVRLKVIVQSLINIRTTLYTSTSLRSIPVINHFVYRPSKLSDTLNTEINFRADNTFLKSLKDAQRDVKYGYNAVKDLAESGINEIKRHYWPSRHSKLQHFNNKLRDILSKMNGNEQDSRDWAAALSYLIDKANDIDFVLEPKIAPSIIF